MEKPRRGKTAKVPMRETGTASAGYEGRPPPLEEEEDHEDDEAQGLEEGGDDIVDPLPDGPRRVEGDRIVEVRGKALLRPLHHMLYRLHGGEGIRARRLVDAHEPRRLTVHASFHVVDLGPQLDAGHVLQADYGAVGIRPEHNGAEFLGGDKPSLGAHRVGELLAGGRGLRAELARGIDRILLLQRVDDIREP